MNQLQEWINTDDASLIMVKIGFSILLFIVLGIIRRILIRILNKTSEDVRERYYWRNVIRYSMVVLGLVGIGFIWIDQVGSVATFLGLIGAGLVISLKEPILNMAGFLFILVRRPFNVGDRVEIGSNAGDVIDIRLFQFTINEIGKWVEADQSTGRIVHLPNSIVFTTPQVNFNKGFGFLWNEIGVSVTFESNWKKAKDLLLEIAKREGKLSEEAKKNLRAASETYLIFYKKLDPIVYTSIRENGVKLIIRYLTKHQQRRGTENQIYEDILKEFEKHDDIVFAYPTQRIFYRPGENESKEN